MLQTTELLYFIRHSKTSNDEQVSNIHKFDVSRPKIKQQNKTKQKQTKTKKKKKKKKSSSPFC